MTIAMKLEQYRELTAEMCGVDINNWYPDTNEDQRQMVDDKLHERGYAACFIKMEIDGIIYAAACDLRNPRRDEIFQGQGDSKIEAFTNAVIQYYEIQN